MIEQVVVLESVISWCWSFFELASMFYFWDFSRMLGFLGVVSWDKSIWIGSWELRFTIFCIPPLMGDVAWRIEFDAG